MPATVASYSAINKHSASRDGKTEGFPLSFSCFRDSNHQLNLPSTGSTPSLAQNMPANTGTTLLDLPDELLDRILAAVKWDAFEPLFGLDALDFDQFLTQNTPDIQAVRLTCRRLASRASVLLLPMASVAISDPSSVDCLEQIAHPPSGCYSASPRSSTRPASRSRRCAFAASASPPSSRSGHSRTATGTSSRWPSGIPCGGWVDPAVVWHPE